MIRAGDFVRVTRGPAAGLVARVEAIDGRKLCLWWLGGQERVDIDWCEIVYRDA